MKWKHDGIPRSRACHNLFTEEREPARSSIEEGFRDVQTEPADLDYVLGMVNSAFPATGLSEADVIATLGSLDPVLGDVDR